MFSYLEAAARELLTMNVQIAYFMRGSVQYEDLMWRTPVERQIMADFIKERLEAESKKMSPVY